MTLACCSLKTVEASELRVKGWRCVCGLSGALKPRQGVLRDTTGAPGLLGDPGPWTPPRAGAFCRPAPALSLRPLPPLPPSTLLPSGLQGKAWLQVGGGGHLFHSSPPAPSAPVPAGPAGVTHLKRRPCPWWTQSSHLLEGKHREHRFGPGLFNYRSPQDSL